MRPAPAPGTARRGFALIDALVGSLILGIGLAVTLSITSRSISMQVDGQKQLTASWLLDELLGTVVMDGPIAFPQLNPTNGRFDPPFDEFSYDIDIDDVGLGKPLQVTAIVFWSRAGDIRQVEAQTWVAERRLPDDQAWEIRAPDVPIDRIGRWYPDEEAPAE
jgi:hypothetical protein